MLQKGICTVSKINGGDVSKINKEVTPQENDTQPEGVGSIQYALNRAIGIDREDPPELVYGWCRFQHEWHRDRKEDSARRDSNRFSTADQTPDLRDRVDRPEACRVCFSGKTHPDDQRTHGICGESVGFLSPMA